MLDPDLNWLNKKLDMEMKGAVRQALIEACVEDTIDVRQLKADTSLLRLISRKMKEKSSKWLKVEDKHLSTGFKAMKESYDTLANQLKNRDAL
jgi:hypothetical protein